MKAVFATRVLCGLVLIAAVDGWSQGALQPTAAPAPGMKTLFQVQPARPIEEIPITLTEPGSYYLAGNLQMPVAGNGIIIDADDVVLDLNGFALNGAGMVGSGITLTNNHSNITVRNGIVRNWSGIGINGGLAYNSFYRNLQCYDNGADGLFAGAFSEVRSVLSSANGANGIFIIQGCRVVDCTAHDNSIGLYAIGTGCEIVRCTVQKSATMGIFLSGDSRVRDCIVRNNGGPGIIVMGQSVVTGNQCLWHTNAPGMVVDGEDSRIEKNMIGHNSTGLEVTGTNNYLAGNQVFGNSTNYNLDAANHINLLLSELPELIAWPATVTLAGTLRLQGTASHGLAIEADCVSVDLAGHALIGDAVSLAGIHVAAERHSVSIRNGAIMNWGESGIDAALAMAMQVDDVIASTNRQYGMNIGANSVVRNCIARYNDGTGIQAGYNSTVRDCTAVHNGERGISGMQGSVIQNCVSGANQGVGLLTGSGVIRDSSAWQNGSDGIMASVGTIVSDCSSVNNGGNGVTAILSDNVIHDCSIAGNEGEGVQGDVRTMVHDCVASLNSSNGVALINGGVIRDCVVSANTNNGIKATYDVAIRDSDIHGNSLDGVIMYNGCSLERSVVAGHYQLNRRGVRVGDSYNSLADNRVRRNYVGIDVTGTHNVVVRNCSNNNTTNFNIMISVDNDVGIVLPSPGYNFSSDQPWMNME